MRFVTTCHKAGFEQYGHRLLDGWAHFPPDCELVWYTEGYNLPQTGRVVERDIGVLESLAQFKARHRRYVAPYYQWDVVRFAHKVFAVYDALRNHKGIGVWIDADMVPVQDVPQAFLDGLLERGDYIAMFRRKGFYSECGFWIVDCDHPAHGEFFDTLIDLYVADKFKTLQEWHDSYLMDVVVKHFERDGTISVTNLTRPEHMTDEHPMARGVIAPYLDHLKGPDRKKLGFSPEREAA